MENVLKIAAIGLAGALAAVAVKNKSPEMALAVSIATALFIVFAALEFFTPIRKFLDELVALSGISPAIVTPLIKATGISVVTKISAELCRDAKELAIASLIELSGVMVSIYLTLPLLSSVMKLITGLL